LSDDQRRLAASAKLLGRRILTKVATIVTPETLLAWHRKLIARNPTAVADAGPVDRALQKRQKRWWSGWLRKISIGATRESRARLPISGPPSVEPPSPRSYAGTALNRVRSSRKTTGKEFLSRHWELIVTADFFAVEVWTRRGLERFLVLFFIDLSTRKVEIAGIAAASSGLWMSQIARNLTDANDGILHGKQYLIHDRDPLFTGEFLELVSSVGVKSVKLPPR
jgi:putative transposase